MSKKPLRTKSCTDHNKRARRGKRAHRGALALAAAGTAATMALAPITPTPEASAVEIDLMDLIDAACDVATCNFATAGLWTLPIMNFGALLYSIPFLNELPDPILPPGVIDLPGITVDFGPVTLQILGPTDINAVIPQIVALFSPTFFLADGASIAAGLISMQSVVGAHVVVGLMDGALTTGSAIPALQSGIDLNTPGVNAYVLALLRNPGRANGGFASRFIPDLVSGRVSPKTGSFPTCPVGDVCRYEPFKLDVGLGYDSFNDFPWSPWASVSIINSVMQSIFFTNMMGDFETIQQQDGNNYYMTIVPADAAILEPLRFPGRLIDLVGIPFNPFFAVADALEPAMDVLINVGYADVDLTTYERSFMEYNVNKTFWESTLTPDQYFAAVGVAIQKAIDGLTGLITSGFGLFGANPALAQSSDEATHASSQAQLDAVLAEISAEINAVLAQADPAAGAAATASSDNAAPAAAAVAADAADNTGGQVQAGDDQGQAEDDNAADDQGQISDDQGQVDDGQGDDQGQVDDDEGDDQGLVDHDQSDDPGQASDDAADDQDPAADDNDQGNQAGDGAGSDSGTSTSSGSGTSTSSGGGTSTSTGTSAGSGTGTDSGSGTGTGSNTGTGSGSGGDSDGAGSGGTGSSSGSAAA